MGTFQKEDKKEGLKADEAAEKEIQKEYLTVKNRIRDIMEKSMLDLFHQRLDVNICLKRMANGEEKERFTSQYYDYTFFMKQYNNKYKEEFLKLEQSVEDLLKDHSGELSGDKMIDAFHKYVENFYIQVKLLLKEHTEKEKFFLIIFVR